MYKSIHQEIVFKASAKRIYDALTNAKQFSEFTGGAPAESVPEPGGSFAGFGGMITGRFLELIPNQRIVQSWRAGNWSEGIHSVVRLEIKSLGSETRLVFDHAGFPEDQREHLESGWHKMYWEPLKQYFA